VSEDPVRAQKKYGHPFCYRNTAKLIFSTNKIPDSYDKSYAYFKRWLILSFDKVFHGITKDTNLINKLTTPEELSAMLWPFGSIFIIRRKVLYPDVQKKI
jgi:putative DNA primase/helicase